MAMTNNQKNVARHQARNKPMHLKIKKGALHSEMGVPAGQKIPVEKLEHEKAIAKKDNNTTLERRVNFALTARNWHHR